MHRLFADGRPNIGADDVNIDVRMRGLAPGGKRSRDESEFVGLATCLQKIVGDGEGVFPGANKGFGRGVAQEQGVHRRQQNIRSPLQTSLRCRP